MVKIEFAKELAKCFGNVISGNWEPDNVLPILFSLESSKSEKFKAGVKLLTYCLPPDIVSKIADLYSISLDNPVFSTDYYQQDEKLKFLGKGEGKYVTYRLKSKRPDQPSFALKFNFNFFQETNPQILMEQIRSQRKENLEIRDVLENVPGLIIPNEDFFIMKMNNGNPGICMLQQLFPVNLRDIFTLSRKKLTGNLLHHKDFARSVGSFVETFKLSSILLENQLDLYGRKNLSVLGMEESCPQLVLLDAHYLAPEFRSTQSREYILNRVSYLESLLTCSRV